MQRDKISVESWRTRQDQRDGGSRTRGKRPSKGANDRPARQDQRRKLADATRSAQRELRNEPRERRTDQRRRRFGLERASRDELTLTLSPVVALPR